MARVTITERPLDEDVRYDVLELAAAARLVDQHAPLSEQVLLDVRRPAENRRVAHILLWDQGELVGYAHLDLAAAPDPAAPRTGEMVVLPEARRRGFGSVLLAGLRGLTGTADGVPGDITPPVSVWAHVDLPAARDFAAAQQLERTRELHIMGIDLAPPADPADEYREEGAAAARAAYLSSENDAAGDGSAYQFPWPETPEGVDLATFWIGRDEEAWVALNARAFADHPEQGRMTVLDLRARQAEPWFNAQRLWLMREAGQAADTAAPPLASLWVKQQPGEDVAELYVLGVDPDAQGRGLGSWLTRVALADAAKRGARRMILYVDGVNTAAVNLYRRAGFEIDHTEAQYTG